MAPDDLAQALALLRRPTTPIANRKPMKTMMLAIAVAVFASGAWAQETPKFYKDTYPQHALKSRLKAEDVLIGESDLPPLVGPV